MGDPTSKVFVLPFHMKNQLVRESDKKLFEDPEINYLRELDASIKSVLFETGLPPEIKYKKYVELLNKYSAVMKNVTRPFEIEMTSRQPSAAQQQPQVQNGPQGHENPANQVVEGGEGPTAAAPITTTTTGTTEPSGSRVKRKRRPVGKLERTIDAFPLVTRDKAKEVIKVLREDPSIKWDARGKIYLDKKAIEGSSIYETLADLMKVRKIIHPGFREIVQSLYRKELPLSYIVNKTKYKDSVKTITRDFSLPKTLMNEIRDDNTETSTSQRGSGYFNGYKQLRW